MENERILLEKELEGSIYSKEDIKEMDLEELKNVVNQFKSFKNELSETSKYFESFSREIILKKLKSLKLDFLKIECHSNTVYIAIYNNNIISRGNVYYGNIDYYFNSFMLLENVTKEEVKYVEGEYDEKNYKDTMVKKFMNL